MQPREYEVMAALEQGHWWYRALRRRLLERLEREAHRRGRPLQVFDAGCGTGGLLHVLCVPLVNRQFVFKGLKFF